MYLIVKAGEKWSLNLCRIVSFGSIFWYLPIFQPEIILQLSCFSTTEASNSSSSLYVHVYNFIPVEKPTKVNVAPESCYVLYFNYSNKYLDPYILLLFLNLASPRTPTEHFNENKFLHIIKCLHIIFKVYGLHGFLL